MPLAPNVVAQRLSQLVVDLDAGTITQSAFVTGYALLWSDSTTGGTSISMIGAQLSSVLGLWDQNQIQFSNWQTGVANYDSPDAAQPDLGYYPMTNYLGITRWFPCPNRMIQDFAGVQVQGTLANTGLLTQSPAAGKPVGTIYIVAGHYWVKNSSGYVDAGSFVGPQGAQGPVGNTGNTGPQGGIGNTGPQGIQGIQGVKGDAYTPNAIGPFSGRAAHDSEAAGYGYLASDQGNIYFRIGTAGNWTAAIPFGKGDKGDIGNTGPQGVIGNTGPQGVIGNTGPQGPQGIQGVQGAGFIVNAVGPFSGRAAHDGDAVGSVYLANDERKIYVRITGGGWSAGSELISGSSLRFAITGALTPGVAQSVTIPIGATDIGELQVFFNGLKVLPGDSALALTNASTVGFTPPAELSGVYEIILPGGIKGADGASFTPNAVGLAAGRSTYDAQAAGFVYLATDTGVLYIRSTATAGTWAGPFSISAGATGPAGDAGINAWTLQAANFNAAAKGRYLVTASVTTTLPVAPVDGDELWLAGNRSGAPITIARNGKTINGLAANAIIDVDSALAVLVYFGGDWRVLGNWRTPVAKTKIVAASTLTLAAADHGWILEFSGACVVTVDAAALFAGFNCSLARGAAGDVSWAAAAGTNLRLPDAHTKLRNLYSEAGVRVKSGTDVWVQGDTKA